MAGEVKLVNCLSCTLQTSENKSTLNIVKKQSECGLWSRSMGYNNYIFIYNLGIYPGQCYYTHGSSVHKYAVVNIEWDNCCKCVCLLVYAMKLQPDILNLARQLVWYKLGLIGADFKAQLYLYGYKEIFTEISQTSLVHKTIFEYLADSFLNCMYN